MKEYLPFFNSISEWMVGSFAIGVFQCERQFVLSFFHGHTAIINTVRQRLPIARVCVFSEGIEHTYYRAKCAVLFLHFILLCFFQCHPQQSFAKLKAHALLLSFE